MTVCTVFDKTTGEREEFYTLTPAKKWMQERMKLGHEVSGSRTKFYANGDFESLAPIQLKGNNRAFVANTRQKKPGY